MAEKEKKKKTVRTAAQLREQHLTYSLEREEVPITISGKAYTLKELDGKDRDKYLSDLAGRIKTTPAIAKGAKATQSVKNFDGLQSGLLSKCLFDENDKAVPAATIQGWPARVISDLFDAAKELSGIESEEDEDEEGNE